MSTDTTNIPTPRTDALARQMQRDYSTVPAYRALNCLEFARQLERELAQAKDDLAAARKDSERLKWLFSGYAVARWSHEHEVGAVDRDTLMYSMFDLDDDIQAKTEGGER